MKRSIALLLTVLTVVLSGCAAQPQSREPAYTDAEVKQFALEVLSRSSLSMEDYEKIRKALLNPNHSMSNSIRDVKTAAEFSPDKG
ncbi:hypothetical protein [Pseudomonas sp. S9]|uniref:hypothetical protein n=1 Tax=Pseudomonas sp. S9 TaxID=686578 RepID=UPI000255710F|nr:hypothetical protein [Pseudomonas sp. S9]